MLRLKRTRNGNQDFSLINKSDSIRLLNGEVVATYEAGTHSREIPCLNQSHAFLEHGGDIPAAHFFRFIRASGPRKSSSIVPRKKERASTGSAPDGPRGSTTCLRIGIPFVTARSKKKGFPELVHDGEMMLPVDFCHVIENGREKRIGLNLGVKGIHKRTHIFGTVQIRFELGRC